MNCLHVKVPSAIQLQNVYAHYGRLHFEAGLTLHRATAFTVLRLSLSLVLSLSGMTVLLRVGFGDPDSIRHNDSAFNREAASSQQVSEGIGEDVSK